MFLDGNLFCRFRLHELTRQARTLSFEQGQTVSDLCIGATAVVPFSASLGHRQEEAGPNTGLGWQLNRPGIGGKSRRLEAEEKASQRAAGYAMVASEIVFGKEDFHCLGRTNVLRSLL